MGVKIPYYEQQTLPQGEIRAQAQPLQSTPVLGEAVERFGDAAGTVSSLVMRDIAEGNVRQADNQVSEQVRNILYDPKAGYLTTTGKAALDGFGDVQQRLKDIGNSIGGTLNGTAEQGMFKDLFDRRINAALNTVTAHAAQQSQQFNLNEARARADNGIADAIDALDNPTQYNLHKNTAVTDSQFGLTGAEAELAKRTTLSKINVGAIDQLIATNQPQRAQAWFDANKADIDPLKRDDVENRLKTASVKQQSLNLSFQIGAQSGDINAQEKDLKARYEKGDINAEVYDATRQRLQADYQLKKSQEADYNNSMEGQAQDWLLNHRGAAVTDLPQNLYSWARGKGKLDTLDGFSNRINNPGKDEGDPALFTDLMLKFGTDPYAAAQDFQKNSATYRGSLNTQQYNLVLSHAQAGLSNDAKAAAMTKQLTEIVTQNKAELAAAGIDTTPKEGTEKANQWAQYQGALIQAINDAQKERGRALTQEEGRAIGRQLLDQGRLPNSGFIWDSSRRRYQVTPDESRQYGFRANYAAIPTKDRAQIDRFLMGRPDLWPQYGVKPAKPGTAFNQTPEWQKAVQTLYEQAVARNQGRRP